MVVQPNVLGGAVSYQSLQSFGTKLSGVQRLFLLGLGSLLMFNYGLQVRTVAGIPAGEIVIFLGFACVYFHLSESSARFTELPEVIPLVIVWIIAAAHLVYDVPEYGFWALRDCNHAIESITILAGFAAPIRMWIWVNENMRYLILAVVVYASLFLFRETLFAELPSIVSSSGSEAVLVQFISTSSLLIVCAFTLLMSYGERRPVLTVVVFAVILAYVLIVFQSRTSYLQIAACSIYCTIVRRSVGRALGLSFFLILLVVSIVSISGFVLPTRLGVDFDAEAMFRHILAIGGIETEGFEAAASGVGQRLTWWTEIWERTTADPITFFFGSGYGLPLIDYVLAGEVTVREPHNSYLSTFGRLGAIGSVCFLIVHASALHRVFWISQYLEQNTLSRSFVGNFVWAGSMLLIVIIVFALGEDGFEKPFWTVPFYLLVGAIARILFELRDFRTDLP